MLVNKSAQIGFSGQIGKTQRSLFKVLERLSTGRRINRASDDAAGLAVAEQLMTQVRGFRQATTNVDYASAAMYIGEGASNEITNMLQRQRELAVQASNDTLTDDQRAALNEEYQALTQEIERTAQSSQFNTQSTANGQGIASGNAQVMVGANVGDEVTLPQADFTISNLGITTSNISSGANARTAINEIDSAMNVVNQQRTNLGSMLNRLEHTRDNLVNQTTNTQAAESVIRDMDMAFGAAEFVRQGILNQSSIMTLRNFNAISQQNMMALLGG